MILIESSFPSIWRSIDLRGLIHWHRVHSLIVLSFPKVLQFFTSKNFKHKPKWLLQIVFKREKNTNVIKTRSPKFWGFIFFTLFLELFKYIIILKLHRFLSYLHFSVIFISQLSDHHFHLMGTYFDFAAFQKSSLSFFFYGIQVWVWTEWINSLLRGTLL